MAGGREKDDDGNNQKEVDNDVETRNDILPPQPWPRTSRAGKAAVI